MKLTPKERVLAVANHKTPAVMASTFKGTEEVDRQVMDYLGVNTLDELIAELGVCHVHWPWRNISPAGVMGPKTENGIVYDIWGVGRREVKYDKGSYWEMAHCPLANAETAADVENYDWPTIDRLDFSGVAAECEKYKDFAQTTWQWMVFERAYALRGFEQFLMDLALNEKLAQAIIAHVEEFNWRIIDKLHEVAGDYFQFFGAGDDLGSQTSLLMSVQTWEKFFEPGYRKAFEFAHSRGQKTWMHCDGAVRPLIPKFIDVGLDILDPLMPMIDEMNPYKIVPEFGRDLCFHGTIDVQNLMPFGTEQQVRDEIRRQLDKLWSRGNVFMSPSHCIQPGTPIENIMAVYDELKKA